MQNIWYFTAFFMGIGAFFTHCVLSMMPIYLALLSAKPKRLGRLALTGLFVLGYAVVYAALGLLAGTLSPMLLSIGNIFEKVSGVILVLLGAAFLFEWHLFKNLFRPKIRAKASVQGAFILGLAMAFAWLPCLSPLILSALDMAAQGGKSIYGLYVMGLFSLGLSLGFWALSIFVQKVQSLFTRLQGKNVWLRLAGGLLLITLGVLLIFGVF